MKNYFTILFACSLLFASSCQADPPRQQLTEQAVILTQDHGSPLPVENVQHVTIQNATDAEVIEISQPAAHVTVSIDVNVTYCYSSISQGNYFTELPDVQRWEIIYKLHDNWYDKSYCS